MTDVKPRFPRDVALGVARELCDALKPVTLRLLVAGSLRRRKPAVGDVEILFIPIRETRQKDMFAVEIVSLADEVIAALLASGTIHKRVSRAGAASWGPSNKLAVHTATGIPVDLFTATEDNWSNYVVCRTGPSHSNIRIAAEAKKRGWQWKPYGNGFSRGGVLAGEKEIHLIASEEEVFRFVGLPYLQPWER
jgi:DNA polymerase/3'-5' exonuclease PolX